ncbi:dihydroflavonol-4-reductase [Furfurilactobacillus sp. OKN36]
MRATLRSMKRAESARAAIASLGAPHLDDLTFVQADLSADAGWSAAMAGVSQVYHVASPFPMTMPKDENDVIIPAREGVKRVLTAAVSAGVKRLVMTAAFGDVAMGYDKSHNDHVYTERDWSNVAPDSKITAYYKSKTLAEQDAWEFATAHPEMELVTMLPVAVLGPVIGPRITGSNSLIESLVKGTMPGYLHFYMPIVDVRDLVSAHILAMTTPAAAGQRFIISNGQALSFKGIGTILANGVTAPMKLPRVTLPNWAIYLLAPFNGQASDVIPELDVRRQMSSQHAADVLHWHPQYTVADTIVATANSILALS